MTQQIHNSIVKIFNGEIKSNDYMKSMYLCGLYVLSFKNEHIVSEYYEKIVIHDTETADIENKERRINFIKEFIENCKEYIKKYPCIEIMYNTFYNTFNNMLGKNEHKGGQFIKLGRDIYELYKQHVNAIGELFDQFLKDASNGKAEMKNSEWTPLHISKIMTELTKIYTFEGNVKVLEPCIGANNLIHALDFEEKTITGFETNEMLATVSTIDNIVNGIYDDVYNEDFILTDKIENKQFDLAITNPPYTKQISGYEAIEFVYKSMLHSKHGIFILPASQIDSSTPSNDYNLNILRCYTKLSKNSQPTTNNKKLNTDIQKLIKNNEPLNSLLRKPKVPDYRDALFNMCHIDFILSLGDNVFEEATTGEIVIMALSKKKFAPYEETRYKEFIMGCDVVKAAVKQGYKKFTKAGNEKFNSLLTDYKIIEPKFGSGWLCLPTSLIDWCRIGLESKYRRLRCFNKLPYALKSCENILNSDINEDLKSVKLIKLIYESEKQIEQFDSLEKSYVDILNNPFNIDGYISDLCPEIANLDESRFKKVRLGDIFEEVKKTTNYKYSTTDTSLTGDVPLYACKKLDNGIACYVPNAEAEGHYLVVIHHRDATCGYCFENNGPLAWNSSCFVYNPIKEIDLKINSILLTTQISPSHLESEHFTSKEFLNKIVYIYE